MMRMGHTQMDFMVTYTCSLLLVCIMVVFTIKDHTIHLAAGKVPKAGQILLSSTTIITRFCILIMAVYMILTFIVLLQIRKDLFMGIVIQKIREALCFLELIIYMVVVASVSRESEITRHSSLRILEHISVVVTLII